MGRTQRRHWDHSTHFFLQICSYIPCYLLVWRQSTFLKWHESVLFKQLKFPALTLSAEMREWFSLAWSWHLMADHLDPCPGCPWLINWISLSRCLDDAYRWSYTLLRTGRGRPHRFLVFSLLVKRLRTNQNFCYSNLIGSVKKYPSQPPQLTQLHWQKPQTGHIYTSKECLLLGSFILFKEPVGFLSL